MNATHLPQTCALPPFLNFFKGGKSSLFRRFLFLPLLAGLSVNACRSPGNAATAFSYPKGLLLALAQFELTPDGKATNKPGPARLEILVRGDGTRTSPTIEDRGSNVI